MPQTQRRYTQSFSHIIALAFCLFHLPTAAGQVAGSLGQSGTNIVNPCDEFIRCTQVYTEDTAGRPIKCDISPGSSHRPVGNICSNFRLQNCEPIPAFPPDYRRRVMCASRSSLDSDGCARSTGSAANSGGGLCASNLPGD